VLALAFGLIFLLITYYRPTLEIDDDISAAGLASALLLPFAFSAVLAYTPALRRSARSAVAFCVAVGVADFVWSVVTISPRPAAQEIQFYALLALMPMLALFAASRLPLSRRFPTSLLFIGPTAFWLGLLFSIYVWVELLGRAD
jgi:hypothetical protein